MPRSSLTGKQRRHLRALAHPLKPLVQVGRGGIDDGLVAAVDQALADHELIKVKVGEAAGLDRHEAADAIAEKTHSEIAQVLGNTIILYRADPDDPQIKLPKVGKDESEPADSADDVDEADDDDDDADDDADDLGDALDDEQ